MKRIKDEFFKKLTDAIPLSGKEVLEVGCGEGTRSQDIARACKFLYGIDPSESDIAAARERNIPNTLFNQGSAENLVFDDNSIDVVIFTLSFHHVPKALMRQSIDEVLRVLRPGGWIVFLEPGMNGSLFDAEIDFDAYDGDEREVKKESYAAMMTHPNLKLFKEIADESVFQFDSLQDFMESMSPKKSIGAIEPFLARHNYVLNAERRINIFQPK
ncbi:MAG: methyltransferase domain-containing protein [Candidatus Taylorbacteria bacterium]|nr:methyltransferase domain-containing protein [Candidatus Taylorbacteria bacterium]